ncbi:MAG TPA: EF-Tu/IF-2/RF-3 family GTPase, partial [Gammaproteobacteria bacterium]|nr:EF-Tu/IF-2/RF-3 family GTPase [Gammaproteobacteria bacterium]
RPGARPDWVVDQTFDLFDNLGANDDQLDFPVIYCSALNGYASEDSETREGDMSPLFQTIVDNVAVPDVDPDAPFQLQVSALDYNKFTGVIGVGRVTRGTARQNQQVSIIDRHGETRSGKIGQVFGFRGLEKIEVSEASAGDIISFTGIDPLSISDTLCDPSEVEPLPALTVDEPTVSMNFLVNKSPFAGREGKYVTSRQIKDRLEQELVHNVALRVEQTEDAEKLRVSGRGELHLATLIETMRREGYELAVSRPEVVIREIEGAKEEPYEHLTVDVPEDHQGTVMEKVGERGGELKDMAPDGKGRVRLDYEIPARGLIGFRSEFLTATSGEGLMFHVFDHYGAVKPGDYGRRVNGVLISMSTGKTVEYALFNLQDRGAMFVGPGEDCYEGQIVGRHVRDNDLVVNPFKGKQLTNVRAAGSDENVILVPPERPSLEEALEFIDDDELVEVTPESIRLRKKLLTENERKKAGRG